MVSAIRTILSHGISSEIVNTEPEGILGCHTMTGYPLARPPYGKRGGS